MYNFMWNDDKKDIEFKKASNEVEEFFGNIRDKKLVTKNKGVKFVYRKGQHMFARDVMTAIRDNQILLVQAGVGIGKSMGYLIPIFSSFDKVSGFDNIVISTSNIGLQQQLLTDIKFISNLLGIDIKVSIAKGINNYACIKEIDRLISVSGGKNKELLLELKHMIDKKETIDRDELVLVSDKVWEQIQMKNRGACSRCNYSRECLFRNISKDINKSDIVITNHANFVKSVIDDRDYINNADMFVFDEAHKLEEAIRNIGENTLNINNMRRDINYYVNNGLLCDKSSIMDIDELIADIDKLFSGIRKKSSYYFNKNRDDKNIKITDCDKIPLDSRYFLNDIRVIIIGLDKLIKRINYYKMNEGRYFSNDFVINNLKGYLKIFEDMAKGSNSRNIYWVNYYRNNKIHIGYVQKSNINITQNIFGRDIPIVCTSGTLLDANGSYNYFKRGLSLDKISSVNRTVVDGRVHKSPYDYDKNSLFYYDTSIANPKNIHEYILGLIDKIRELIKITNGRCLVLFTSKSTMESVYKVLSKEDFGFDLMMQGQMSNSQLCNKFESDVKSCLFATGAFWEGVDIKGKALCNVIITRLPFSNVDAITEYKASEFSKEEAFNMVYLNDMVQKIAQGTGRLIRGSRDKGIICCLDSRCAKYIDVIKRCTPYTNFTTDINDVYDFSSKYITNRDGKRKIRKK